MLCYHSIPAALSQWQWKGNLSVCPVARAAVQLAVLGPSLSVPSVQEQGACFALAAVVLSLN